jgi:riboflavin kinase/FMN adenylyltransferase
MEVVRGLHNLRERHHGAVATIGSFDGLHVGHQAMIARARALAAQRGRKAIVVTFEPLPREFLAPQAPPARLTSFRERCELLAERKVDAMLVLRFVDRLRNTTGEDFARLLSESVRCSALVVGHDFRFGRNGATTAASLAEMGGRLGFDVEILPPVLSGGERASSTAVRAALAASDFAQAAQMLGRPYSMRGRVVEGTRLGRTLGFPTANLRLERRRSPVWGIFAVRVNARGARGAEPLRHWPGVASLGTRPTVGGVEPVLEAHLFDFAGDLYGREIEIELVAKLRDEVRFESLDALVVQMRRDAEAARQLLAS